jgi:hypothetical protein
MIEEIDKEINGMRFHFNPLPAKKALKLDKRVITLLVPIFGGLKDLNLNSGIDTETMARGVSEALSNMTDEDYDKFIIDLLSATQYYQEGVATPVEITSTVIDTIFRGELATLYKLMFEIMKYNKFFPFALGVGGKGILGMFTSQDQKQSEKKNGKKLETSGLLQET